MLICCRTGGFPSNPNVGSPSRPPSENINSLTNIFPKNISNLSRRDNNDVATTPSVASCENHKIYQKESVWMKRRSSPISVLELGRKPAIYDRKPDCQSSVWSGYKASVKPKSWRPQFDWQSCSAQEQTDWWAGPLSLLHPVQLQWAAGAGQHHLPQRGREEVRGAVGHPGPVPRLQAQSASRLCQQHCHAGNLW